MIDLGRYRALVHVLGGVLAALVAIDVCLRLAFGMAPAALLRASFHDSPGRELVASRVSAVIASPPPAPVAAVIGASSAYDGLLPPVLDASDPAHRRWLNLATTGSSFDELRFTFGPLFASDLHPDLLVLAIHPGWLAGRLVGDPDFDAIMLSADTPQTSWLLFHRGLVNHVAHDALAEARTRLLAGWLRLPFPAVHAPAADPWITHPRSNGKRDLAAARGQLDVWRAKRWFDADWYAHADAEIAAAADLIASAQRTARRVVIVLMPESSTLRAAMPGAALEAFHRALARLSSPLVVVDLRAAIPDEVFLDHIHLDQAGAERLSRLLPVRVEP